jgi:hypothetical protein
MEWQRTAEDLAVAMLCKGVTSRKLDIMPILQKIKTRSSREHNGSCQVWVIRTDPLLPASSVICSGTESTPEAAGLSPAQLHFHFQTANRPRRVGLRQKLGSTEYPEACTSFFEPACSSLLSQSADKKNASFYPLGFSCGL